MKHELQLTVNRVEGAILRTLGLIERRGFAVTAIKTAAAEPGSPMDMVLEVESSGRSVDVLVRQVAKLIDVCAVARLETQDAVLVMDEGIAC